MRKYYLLGCLLILMVFTSAQPIITSFAPTSGPVGTTVTISGANFSSSVADNIVYFGVTRASVTAASSTSLTVTVPSGASFEPVTVTVNGLIAATNSPFKVTFPGGGTPLHANSFDKFERISTGGTFAVTDINGDNKPDLTRMNNGYMALLKNNSISGMPLFQPFTDTTKKNRSDSPVARGDMDGDGRLDLVVVRKDSTAFTIFRNISTASRPQFDTGVSFRTPPYAYSVAIGDIDGDGKNDIVIGGYDYYAPDTLVVHRNTSVNGKLSFTEALKIPAAFTCVRISDLNGDNKPDVVAIPYGGFSFTVLKNNSSPGSISFTSSTFDMSASGVLNGVVCDFNDDGKPDVAIGKYSTSGVNIIKNTSTASTISFASAGIYQATSGNRPQFLAADDVDGDGRPDIISANFSANSVSVIRNTNTTAGTFSFASNIDFPVAFGSDPADIATTDLDGDSKPEIVLLTTYSNNYLNVFRNAIGEPVAITLCPPAASTSIASGIAAGTSYQWQVNDGNGYVNIPAGTTFYGGSNTSTLSITNAPSSWYGYQFRCLVDGVFSKEYVLKFKSNYIGPVNGNWSTASNWNCNALPDANTDVTITYGNINVDVNTTVRSLRVNEAAKITVATGKSLTINK